MSEKQFDPPRWKGGPKICITANLPAFETVAIGNKWLNKNGGDHPTPTLATWRCHACKQIHFWTAGSQTDSNGGFKGGANIIPKRIQKLISDALPLE